MDQPDDRAAIERLAAYLRGDRGDLEPGDLDRVYAELERLQRVEQRARKVDDLAQAGRIATYGGDDTHALDELRGALDAGEVPSDGR